MSPEMSAYLLHWLSSNLTKTHPNLVILVSLREPLLLHHIDRLTVLRQGKVILDEDRLILQNMLNNDESETLEECVRTFVHQDTSDSFQTNRHTCSPKQESTYQNEEECYVSTGSKRDKQALSLPRKNPFSQISPTSERLVMAYGSNVWDFLVIPLAFAIVAYFVTLAAKSPRTLTLACWMLLLVPILLLQHHVLQSNRIWLAHRYELQDRRISAASYQMATHLYSFSIALLSTFVALVIAYVILDWDWSSFPNQVVFTCVYLLCMLSMGRCLSVALNGHHVFYRIYLVFIFLNLCFSGFVSTPRDAPESIRWLYRLSFTFWASAGVLSDQFEHNSKKACGSFATCLQWNGNVLATQSGYWPYTDARQALNVLTVIYLGAVIAEYALLLLRRKYFTSNKLCS